MQIFHNDLEPLLEAQIWRKPGIKANQPDHQRRSNRRFGRRPVLSLPPDVALMSQIELILDGLQQSAQIFR
jgi:hypothetical protein